MAEDLVLAVDFGSTFTKVHAVDVGSGSLVGSAQSPTTVGTGLVDGLRSAVGLLPAGPRSVEAYGERFCSSSAAGGLSIVAIGLVPNLTALAARQAALGAGGKVVATFAGKLTAGDVDRVSAIAPEVIVLAGGIDGGDVATVLHNAAALALADLGACTIVAGNHRAAQEAVDILTAGGRRAVAVANVLPDLSRLDTAACTEAIRVEFMERIVEAKGFGDVESELGKVLMPTPQAVLNGCALLADADGGLGELMCVDVGGATTDVYSVARGAPVDPQVPLRGLPEPRVKRTVEGDLGVRANAASILDAAALAGLPIATEEAVAGYAAAVAAAVDTLPASTDDRALDVALAAAAVELAARRHAGRLDVGYGSNGRFSYQTGKDLRGVPTIVGTGGVIARSSDPQARAILGAALSRPATEELLPDGAQVCVDRAYFLFAAGLLAAAHPEAALRIVTEGLVWLSR